VSSNRALVLGRKPIISYLVLRVAQPVGIGVNVTDAVVVCFAMNYFRLFYDGEG